MLDDLPTGSEKKEMLKINQEEYKILKELEDKDFKWLAKDRDKELLAFQSRPSKAGKWAFWVNARLSIELELVSHLFQFIQWEDEEPWSVQELIDEYLDDEYGYFNMNLSREFEEFIEIEREEAEVKKDIEWVKEELKMNNETYNLIEDFPEFADLINSKQFEYAQKLIQIRLSSGLGFKEMADIVGYTPEEYLSFEYGEQNINIEEYEEVIRKLEEEKE